MRFTSRTLSGAVLAICLSTAGCATTITGQATANAHRAGSTAGSTPDPAASTGSDPAGGDRTELSCSGDVVQPDGAPYCYTSPPGLSPADLQGVDAGEEGVYRTSFGTQPKDYVDVQVYELSASIDEASDDQVITQLATVIMSLETSGFSFDATPEQQSVDGARDFVYTGTSADGSQAIVSHFIFRGQTELQVNCSSTSDSAAIDPACQAVLGSMQVTG